MTVSCRRRRKRSITRKRRTCRSSWPSTRSTSPKRRSERVKRQLADVNLLPAEWGGDTEFVEVSAKQKTGHRQAAGNDSAGGGFARIEGESGRACERARCWNRAWTKDAARWPRFWCKTERCNSGDFFICGSVFGKVRAMFDDRGRPTKDAPPSTPVEVLGLQGVPDAGDHFQVTDEAKARHIVEYRQAKQRDAADGAFERRAHHARSVARATEGWRRQGTGHRHQGATCRARWKCSAKCCRSSRPIR